MDRTPARTCTPRTGLSTSDLVLLATFLVAGIVCAAAGASAPLTWGFLGAAAAGGLTAAAMAAGRRRRGTR